MLERATRLCWRSPRMVTFRLSILPRRSRIVSASSKALGGMFVSAVAGVDDRNVEMASDKIGCARRSVAHDQAIGLHGVERLHSVEERFTFFYAG